MINMKNQKGSITLLVLTSCLFFVVAVTTVGMHMQAKKTAVDREYKQVKASYEKDLANAESIYDELSEIQNLPVYFSIPDINENEKNITISFSLNNPNANIETIKYGWLSSEEEIEPSSSDITDWVYLEDKNNENTVVAKRKYTDDIDYYYLCVMINNKEFWPKAPVKVSADASYYGDQIDYDIDLGNNADGEPLNIVGTDDYDWEIFYNDGTNIYLIAEDYVPLANPLMPTNLGNNTSQISTKPYSLYWSDESQLTKNGAIDIFGNSATIGTKYIANKYLSKWKEQTTTSTNINAKVTAELMDTNNWINFSDSENVKNKTSKLNELIAIGSVPLEMWVNSWNKKYSSIEEKIYIRAKNSGYLIGIEENPTTYFIDNKTKTGYSNKLYYPHIAAYKSSSSYWIASPSADTNNYVMIVTAAGLVNRNTYDNIYCAVRPIVCLPSDITAEWDGNSNVWKIIKKPF